MAKGCCSPKGLRLIRVGGSKAGVTGLDQLLEEMYQQGWEPRQQGLGPALLTRLRAAGNYVVPEMEAAYQEALTHLYRDYVQAARRRKPQPADN